VVYSCLVAREKITITFVERFICLLLVSKVNLLSKSKSHLFNLFTNFTSYILPSSTKNEGKHPSRSSWVQLDCNRNVTMISQEI
jgi:hypothetical protein